MDMLKGSEALYGFAGWLMNRPVLTVAGANVAVAPMSEAVRTYIEVQNLSAPRDNWTNYTVAMPPQPIDDNSPEAILSQWEHAKELLDVAKAQEARLRKAAIEAVYPNGIGEGANTVELADGVKLTATGKINYRLDSDTDKVDKALNRLEAAGPEGKLLAERLVSWKPALAVGEYRKLEDKYRKIIDSVIITSEGAPTLAIKRSA